jgi:hypothetical protein
VLRRDHSLHHPSHALLMQLQRCSKAEVPQWLAQAANGLPTGMAASTS